MSDDTFDFDIKIRTDEDDKLKYYAFIVSDNSNVLTEQNVKLIDVDNHKLWYSLLEAQMCGIFEHPQKQMEKLGFNILKSEPVPMLDGWEFVVEKIIEPLPIYLEEIKTNDKDFSNNQGYNRMGG